MHEEFPEEVPTEQDCHLAGENEREKESLRKPYLSPAETDSMHIVQEEQLAMTEEEEYSFENQCRNVSY